MKKKVFGSLFVVIFIGLAAFVFFLWQQGPTYQPPASAPTDMPPPPVATAEPEIRYPVLESIETPLPPLDQSDSAALAALADVFGKKNVKRFFLHQEVIRRFVVTIDSLPREVISAQLQPTTPVGGKLRTAGKGETLTMAQANFERYAPFIRLAEMVDAKTFSAAYVGLYPLFQQAYRDMGYPKGYFNDRFVAVIDHMLAAPSSEGPIALVQPHIFYKFADPELESRSAGHKLMLRIGNENAARIKKKLREIRSELVSTAPKAQ
ncbi:MAG: hypothetical protein A3I66_10815 [Burkholderiales bacterium RIFCSPLOWO2_02_FULL_57_36]|nr:MAG: hypothetical protein A3I66_10815 [Burkholderiales bacterium RIFCSPLOWO2_02_FULL_57_36]